MVSPGAKRGRPIPTAPKEPDPGQGGYPDPARRPRGVRASPGLPGPELPEGWSRGSFRGVGRNRPGWAPPGGGSARAGDDRLLATLEDGHSDPGSYHAVAMMARTHSAADANVPARPPSLWGGGGPDLDEAASHVRGWRVAFTQLDPGSCSVNVREGLFRSLRLIRVCSTAGVAARSRAEGNSNPFQVGFSSSLLWDGRSLREEHLAIADGGNESSLVLPANTTFHVVRMDRARVDALAQALSGGDTGLPRRREIRRLAASPLAALRSELDAALAGDLEGREDVVEALERSVYDRVALALSAPVEPGRPPAEARRRVLSRAEEYMRAHARDRISLVDLCVAADCSERTLRYVFHERYGLSPMALLKRMRLQGLRRDLLHAERGSATVLDLALRWGFWHLGHLGRDYKTFYGETPAATLARGSGAAPDARARARS